MNRITVTKGSATLEEVAALTAALAGIAMASARPPVSMTAPAWARAARREAVGEAPFSDASDARLQAPSTRR